MVEDDAAHTTADSEETVDGTGFAAGPGVCHGTVGGGDPAVGGKCYHGWA